MQLDIEQCEQLESYLRAKGYVAPKESLQTKRLAGGVSNKTVLVNFTDGRSWVLKQALPKLRVTVDWFCDPRRIEREAAGLRCLADLAPHGTITPFIFEDREQHLLAMGSVPSPHENWKNLLLAGNIDEHLVEQFGKLLATIHTRATAQRAVLQPEFSDRSFFESLRLEPYYSYAASQVSAAAPFMHSLIANTRTRSDTLVHGDYSPKNILVHGNSLVLLDHEVIHWGDPAFDLGFSLTHFLSKAHHLPKHRSAFISAAQTYWQTYQRELGGVAWSQDLDIRAVRHTLGCLLARSAGRSLLEYLSPDERTRQVAAVVALMSELPSNVIELTSAFIDRIEFYESH